MFDLSPLAERILDRMKEPTYTQPAPMQGWECPKCGSVYSPWVYECATCKNSNVRVVSGTTSDG
jgi:uncharacterized OB-fold protein